MFNCVFKPRFSKCFKYFFITDSHTLHQNIRDFWITDFLWHSKQHTQYLICCKWCNYHFLNVLHFEHNDILFSDFGSWISLVELNLGTNQLSRLPGMSSWWLYHFNIWEKPWKLLTVFIWVYRNLELLWFTSPHSVVSIALENWQTYNPHLKCSLLNLTNWIQVY